MPDAVTVLRRTVEHAFSGARQRQRGVDGSLRPSRTYSSVSYLGLLNISTGLTGIS